MITMTFMCPVCRRTVNHIDPNTVAPDLICKCQYPDSVLVMVQVWPPIEVKTQAEQAKALRAQAGGEGKG